MRHGAGLNHMRARLWREGSKTCLYHQMRNIKIHGCFHDFTLCDTVKFSIAQHGNFPGWLNAQPGCVKQAHQMAHRNDPYAPIIQRIIASHENIHAPLHRCQGCFQRLPECLCHRICAIELIKRMETPPVIPLSDIAAHHRFDIICAGGLQSRIIITHNLFFSLEICLTHRNIIIIIINTQKAGQRRRQLKCAKR